MINDLRDDCCVLFIRAQLNDSLLLQRNLMIMPCLIVCLQEGFSGIEFGVQG